MADKAKKISELTALASGGLANTDVFVVVDTSASETKKITANSLYNYVSSFPANLNFSTLSSLDSTTVTITDKLVIFDDSASVQKKIDVNELRVFFEDLPSHFPIQRVSVSGNADANIYCKAILCNSSSGTIAVQLPTDISDGKAFQIKNTGSGTVSVQCSGGNGTVENATGGLVSSVSMSSVGMSGYWIWDSVQRVYRLFGGRIS